MQAKPDCRACATASRKMSPSGLSSAGLGAGTPMTITCCREHAKVTNSHKLLSGQHHNIGIIFERMQGRDREALAAFQEAARVNPSDEDAISGMARMKMKLGDAAGALTEVKKCIAMNPKTRAYLCGGNALNRLGQFSESIRYFRIAYKNDPADVEILNNIARVFMHTGDLRRTVVELRRLLELDPKNSTALANLDACEHRMMDRMD